MEKLTSIKLHLNLLIFCGFCIISSSSFITKSYAVNICERTNTMEEILLSLNLKNELLNNTPVCTTTDPATSSSTPVIKRSIKNLDKENGFQDSIPDFTKSLNALKSKKRNLKRRQAPPSWRQPLGLPPGTTIAFCNSSSCCKLKKSLSDAQSNTYNLCRECVHVVTLPGSYSPRTFNHITCQDTDFYETCLTGEGVCTTNTVRKTVTQLNNSNLLMFSFGQSCSCEIRADSIFANFI